MGWIEGVHPAKLMYDDRYAEWRESQCSTARYLPQVAREGEEDEPDVLVQVARIKEERRRRQGARPPSAEPFAWAMPPADDKVTFLNEPTPFEYEDAAAEEYGDKAGVIDLPGFVNDDGDFISPDRFDFETEFGLWLSRLLADGIVTQERFNELGLRKYEHRTATRRELAVERLKALREEGVLDNEQFDQLLEDVDTPGFKLHKNPLYYTRILKYCRMLELTRDFMDDWIDKGMPTEPGSSLEEYIIHRSKKDLTRRSPWPGESELERGKRMIRRAWLHFRGHVNHAIEITKEPGLVSLDPRVSWAFGAEGLNNPYSPGFALHPKVLTYPPELCMILIIHEGMHDSDRLGYGHTKFGKWKYVEEDIGWRVQGDWQESLDKLRSYLWNIMYRMRLQPGPENMHSKNRWESALRKSGIEPPR